MDFVLDLPDVTAHGLATTVLPARMASMSACPSSMKGVARAADS
jgi:hypothetical protein